MQLNTLCCMKYFCECGQPIIFHLIISFFICCIINYIKLYKSKNHPSTFVYHLLSVKQNFIFTLKNSGLAKTWPTGPSATALSMMSRPWKPGYNLFYPCIKLVWIYCMLKKMKHQYSRCQFDNVFLIQQDFHEIYLPFHIINIGRPASNMSAWHYVYRQVYYASTIGLMFSSGIF